jgi:hypothetical protein
MSVYGTSAVKRLSKVQTAELEKHLMDIARDEQPTNVRGMYYMAMGEGLIDKDAQGKRNNYMRVQRRILRLRRDGKMPYYWITDGSRKVYRHNRFGGVDDFAGAAAHIYRKDYWMASPIRVEIWVEKDAMGARRHSSSFTTGPSNNRTGAATPCAPWRVGWRSPRGLLPWPRCATSSSARRPRV